MDGFTWQLLRRCVAQLGSLLPFHCEMASLPRIKARGDGAFPGAYGPSHSANFMSD